MWLASRPLTFRVASDSNANFQIDYSSSNSLTQFVSAIALPSRNLNIKLIDESEAPILTKVSTDELQSKLNYAVLVLLAGLIDAWLGLKWHSVPNEIIGALLIVSSFVASRLLKRAIRAKVRRARNP